jgi:uncharacterized protein (TIGR03437 family)
MWSCVQRTALLALPFLLTALPVYGQSIRDFFNDEQLQHLAIRMDPTDWQALKDRYLEDTYYRCEVTWRGIVLPNAGIRSRGTGSRTPYKPALGIDFSKFNSPQRFLGLKSLVLRNFSQDSSFLRERLAQQVFRRMGLPYSRVVHTRITVNGEYVGLYLAVEPIDKRYLLTHFGEDSGYLYEINGGTGYHFEYLGEDPALYAPEKFEPKTHEDAPEIETLIEWIRTINQLPDTEFAAAMARHLDLGAFVTHVAVDQFLADWDSILADAGMTNFYLYRRTADQRWVFLTWDKDYALSTPDRSVWAGSDRNVLMRRALAVPELRRRFLEALWQAAEIAGGGGSWLESEMQRGLEQIQAAALEDPNKVCTFEGVIARCGNQEFLAGVEYLRGVIRNRTQPVRGEVLAAGYLPPPVWLHAGDAGNAAARGQPVVPGSLVTLEVKGLVAAAEKASACPLPATLAGVRVWIGGLAAPLAIVNAAGVIFEAPLEVPCGPAPLRLERDGQASNTLYVEVRPSAPAVFGVTHADGTPVSDVFPAAPGEILAVWGSGFGPVAGVATGEAAPLDRLITLKPAVTASLGGRSLVVRWAGLAPGFAGLQQLVVELPSDLREAGPLPLLFFMNGEPGEPYVLPVRPVS